MGEWFSKLSTSDVATYNKIVSEAKAGGNPYRLLEEVIAGQEIELQREITPGELLARSEEVAKTFDKVRTVFETIRDGVLQHILAAVEPLAGYFQVLLKYILSFLNNFKIGEWTAPTYGKLDGAIISLNEGFIAQNEKNSAVNEGMLIANRIILQNFAKEAGITDPKELEEFINYYDKTGLRRNTSLTNEQAANIFTQAQVVKKNEGLAEEYAGQSRILTEEGIASLNYRPVTNTSPLAVSSAAASRLAAVGHDLATMVEEVYKDVLKEVGQAGLAKRVEDKAKADEELYNRAKDRYEELKKTDPNNEDALSAAYKKQRELYDKYIESWSAYGLLNEVMADKTYIPGEVIQRRSELYRKESAETAVEQVVWAYVIQQLGANVVEQHIRDNTIRIDLHMDDSKKEFDITIRNTDGKLLGRVQDVANPTMDDIRVSANGFIRTILKPDPQTEAKEVRERRDAERRQRSNQQGDESQEPSQNVQDQP
jgi:hypothetical protein